MVGLFGSLQQSEIGVVISTESESNESERSISPDSIFDSLTYDPVKTRLSESGPERSIVIGLFFRFCFRLRQFSFHWIVSDGVISGMGVLLSTPSVLFLLGRVALCF